MSGNKYADKNGKVTAAGIKRLKKYAKETEEHLRKCGKYNGDRFYMSRIKLLEGGFDELNLTEKTLYVPSYVMFQDTKTGKQYQVRDNGINEYIPPAETPEGGERSEGDA